MPWPPVPVRKGKGAGPHAVASGPRKKGVGGGGAHAVAFGPSKVGEGTGPHNSLFNLNFFLIVSFLSFCSFAHFPLNCAAKSEKSRQKKKRKKKANIFSWRSGLLGTQSHIKLSLIIGAKINSKGIRVGTR